MHGRARRQHSTKQENSMSDVNKVVLAYSGGLDTSVILKWLQDTYQCDVVTFTADLGQGEELEPARTKALKFGIKPENIFIDDLREEFVRDFVFPMFRANTVLRVSTCSVPPSLARSSPSARSRSRAPPVPTPCRMAPPARVMTRSALSSVTTR